MTSLVPPNLNPASLYKEEAKRDATRIRIYNNVLTAIYNRVKAVARIPGNEKSLWYVVPEFIPGTPRFDIGDAILYIVWNLRNTGYTVNYTYPNLLFISWKSHDEYYRAVDSPWSQVLHAAKHTPAISTHSPIVRPQAATTTPVEIQKRKTPLKKTVEFRPTNELIPNNSLTTNPSIVTSLYSSRDTGRISGNHITFV